MRRAAIVLPRRRQKQKKEWCKRKMRQRFVYFHFQPVFVLVLLALLGRKNELFLLICHLWNRILSAGVLCPSTFRFNLLNLCWSVGRVTLFSWTFDNRFLGSGNEMGYCRGDLSFDTATFFYATPVTFRLLILASKLIYFYKSMNVYLGNLRNISI